MNVVATMSSPEQQSQPAQKGVAGRINYAQWDKVTRDLVEEHDQEEEQEKEAAKAKLGLDGKYARSQAEAEERQKLKDVKKVKKTLDKYKKREMATVATFTGLLGPVETDSHKGGESKAADKKTVRITRNEMDAGKRVITIADTSGHSIKDTIVLSQDLSLLESKMNVNAQAKSFQEDSENAVPEEPTKERSIYGIIKAFLNNIHNCTVIIKCKVISGTLEMHNCSNVIVRVESDATIATVQADLSKDMVLEFRDAPSGKNTAVLPHQKKMYWGEDGDDRIFHAGVSNMTVRIVRDDMVDTEIIADYIKDGAEQIGNAKAEEMQFVTSVHDGQLMTEKVVRAGSTTGKNVRAMTQREIDAENKRREKAAAIAIQKAEEMLKIKDKDGNLVEKKPVEPKADDDVEEVLSNDVKLIVDECMQNKARGNEAFGTGEYGQAILLYSLALDKAEELPADAPSSVFPRDVIYSNRAACFLKLGQHEKAEEDARKSLEINPDNIKANFRLGLALHAMGQYYAALPILAKAHKIEPNNKQIKQALGFCEVRLAQAERKRMEG
uniref:Uncharacterized protein n=1 Tax=Amphora coffeiformis TaxID=265554 RepID=A0A7S3L5R1_9STRA